MVEEVKGRDEWRRLRGGEEGGGGEENGGVEGRKKSKKVSRGRKRLRWVKE